MAGRTSRSSSLTGSKAASAISRLLRPNSRGVPPVKITFGRIYLRPLLESDWSDWAALRADSREFLRPWEATWVKDALSRTAFARRIRHQARDWQADKVYSFLIFRAQDDVLLGGVSLSNVRRGIVQAGTLGYWIGELHANQGYMSEGLKALFKFAFEHLALHRLEAACLLDNVASRKVLEKCGFTQEGRARKYLKIDGKWQDHLTFAILRDDLAKEAGAEE